MAVLAIMGESGSGKTTSMRNLDPATTYYIDCDKKGLSWKGWKEQYNAKNKNYMKTDFQQMVLKALMWVDGKEWSEKEKAYVPNPKSDGLKIKTVVIDTINGIMVADEMRRRKEKDFDKWSDLAGAIYDVIDYALNMRDDVNIIFIAHSQTSRDDFGNVWTNIKTSGKKLDKITLESKFTTVLYAKCIDGEYVFETKSNNSTAKTPMGAFETMTVPNDIVSVLDVLKDF